MFGGGFARRVARRYRRRGLSPAASRIADFAAGGGLDGATVLEVGGGVGELSIELLRRGAASATNLELSPAYDEEAARLAADEAVADRMRQQIVDIAATPDEVEAADVVVLHRVVCCYPDYRRLLTATADHCRGRLAFSHPPRNHLTRAFTAAQGAGFAVLGREYRAFVHPPAAMLEVLTDRGLRQAEARPGRIWTVQCLYR